MTTVVAQEKNAERSQLSALRKMQLEKQKMNSILKLMRMLKRDQKKFKFGMKKLKNLLVLQQKNPKNGMLKMKMLN